MGLAAFNRARRIAAEMADKEQQDEEENKPLEKMKVEELKEYAEANDIDLGETTKKAEILAVILASLGGDADGDS